MGRTAKLARARDRGGKPMIALSPARWQLILHLLDTERERLWETNDHDEGMLALAVSDIISDIEEQL